jgi:hypothetical protein
MENQHHYGETSPRSSPSSARAPETNMLRSGREPLTPCTAGDYSSKELISQILICLFGTSTPLPSDLARPYYRYCTPLYHPVVTIGIFSVQGECATLLVRAHEPGGEVDLRVLPPGAQLRDGARLPQLPALARALLQDAQLVCRAHTEF